MSDTVIAVSNTPIFDQLVAERGYDPKFPEHLTKPAFAPVGAAESLYSESIVSWTEAAMSAGYWIAKPVPVISPKISETFSPAELIEQAINPQLHIQQIVKKFTAKWPNVAPVHITRLDNIDGTVTIVVSKAEIVEQTDESVNADSTPAVVKPLSEVRPTNVPDMITTSKVDFEKKPQTITEEFVVRGETTVLPPVFRTTHTIGEDTADALYMKPSAWGSDEE